MDKYEVKNSDNQIELQGSTHRHAPVAGIFGDHAPGATVEVYGDAPTTSRVVVGGTQGGGPSNNAFFQQHCHQLEHKQREQQ